MGFAPPDANPPEAPPLIEPATAPTLPYAPPRMTVFDTGSETCPQGQMPVAQELSPEEARHVLNPLQYLPVVGMIYRQATGETIPPAFAIGGSVVSSAILGGPVGILGSVLMNAIIEIGRLGPDTSRPPVPEGMLVTGSEAGVQTVSPGSITRPDGYLTLATVLPDFLGGNAAAATALVQDSPPPRQVIAAYEAGTMTGNAG